MRAGMRAGSQRMVGNRLVNNTEFSNAGLSEEQAHALWKALERAIHEVHNGKQATLRFAELYRHCYTLCLNKKGGMIYEGVTKCVQDKLGETFKVIVAAQEDLLEVIVREWNSHKLVMSMVRDFLMYMDKQYCVNNNKTPVYDMGLMLFRDLIVRDVQVAGRLQTLLLDGVDREREGEQLDRALMKTCLHMLVEVDVSSLAVYQQAFEVPLLARSRVFFRKEADLSMRQNTCPDYLRLIEKRLLQEEARADSYLHPSTKGKLKRVVQEELIAKYAKRLVEDEKTGCPAMFTANALEDMHRMYTLFSREPGTLVHLRNCMSRLVRATGDKIVKEASSHKNPKQFVKHVLETGAKYNNFVTNAFESDRDFGRALKAALEHFMNGDQRSAQFLSLFIDDMLRKRITAASDAQIEAQLNDVISIFRYLQDKDVFEDCYKQHLAQRLLNAQSVNSDVEKRMIAKLKAECGHQFTSRLEGMFKDMDLSKDVMKKYAAQAPAAAAGLAVHVLTTGFWPVVSVPACTLPSEARARCEDFNAYYINANGGRRLTWQLSLGSAEVKATFKQGRKELIVSTFQMVILMLYNSRDAFSFQEIQDSTKIVATELPRQLLSLAHPKVRILKKVPNTKSLEPDHRFIFNHDYTSNMFRVKIPLLSPSSAALAGPSRVEEQMPAGVIEARKNRVEAALVRVMKSRKTLDHNNLITEVIKQLSARFCADPAFVKKRIESLIEREYLERDPQNRRLYHYLA